MKLNHSLAFTLIIGFSLPSYAKVYKCEVEGKITYSQTRCASEAKVSTLRVYDADKYHLESIAKKQQEEKQLIQQQAIQQQVIDKQQAVEQKKQAQIENELYELNYAYETRRNDILNDIRNIDRGLKPNYSRKRSLLKELDILKRDYLDSIDPAGATERAMSNEFNNLKAKVNRLEKKQRTNRALIYSK